jgi:hypothetical protein
MSLKKMSNSPQDYNLIHEMHLSLRTDSQDAWIYRPPLSKSIIEEMRFPLGVPRCDNRLAEIFVQQEYTVLNPAFDIRCIEKQSKSKSDGLYGTKHAVTGEGRNVLIQDFWKLGG